MEVRTRRSSSSPYNDSPAHSRHGGSPLHYYAPGNSPTQAKTHTDTHTKKYRALDNWIEGLCVGATHIYIYMLSIGLFVSVSFSSLFVFLFVDVGHSCFGFSHCDWLGWLQAVRVAGVHLIIVSQSPGVLHPPTPSKPPSISMCQVGHDCICKPDPNLFINPNVPTLVQKPAHIFTVHTRSITDAPGVSLPLNYTSFSPAKGFNWIVVIWHFVVILAKNKTKHGKQLSNRFYISGHNKNYLVHSRS